MFCKVLNIIISTFPHTFPHDVEKRNVYNVNNKKRGFYASVLPSVYKHIKFTGGLNNGIV